MAFFKKILAALEPPSVVWEEEDLKIFERPRRKKKDPEPAEDSESSIKP